MNSILNQQIIDKYILEGFGEIINPLTEEKMIELINNDKLTLKQVKLWSLFSGDLMIKGIYGRTILHSASYKGQLDIVEYVLDKCVYIDSLNQFRQTPLILASWMDHIDAINLLLDRGANINHQDKDGWSALHFACEWNRLEMVKILVERGINIHLKGNYNKKDESALDVAKLRNCQEIIDYLTQI